MQPIRGTGPIVPGGTKEEKNTGGEREKVEEAAENPSIQSKRRCDQFQG